VEPKNPDTIVIKNKYYPSGLTEQMVWNHYLEYKTKILNEVKNKPLLLFLFVDINKYIVKRNIENNSIKLDDKNYENIINGRTVSISMEPGDKLDYFCIDIDAPDNISESQKKEAVKDIINLYKIMNQVKKIRIISTSNGYHVYGFLSKKISNDKAIEILKKILNIKFKDKYNIGTRGKETGITLDLTLMYSRGSHVVPYCLTREGLIALDITNNWKNYKRENSKVK